jgi:hypothetical protein
MNPVPESLAGKYDFQTSTFGINKITIFLALENMTLPRLRIQTQMDESNV